MPGVPDPNSAEFMRSWGLGAINAQVAFNAGASGQGILVADVDTGADPTRPDLVGAISPLSTNVVPPDEPQALPGSAVGFDPHANDVSSVLAARFNGFGTIGVAFNSTVLSIRADSCTVGTAANNCNTSSPPTQTQLMKNFGFTDADLANGIEFAIQNGARVINLSLGSPSPSSPGLQQALLDATNAGIAVTISAGNDSKAGAPAPNPEFPAQLASQAQFGGLIVAVGASTNTVAPAGSTIATFSNQAGTTENNFLVAPGQNLAANCDASDTCDLVSGTSFAAPHVAGAIALLLQAFPNLTAAQAVNILLTTADPGGDGGINTVYGRGILDLTKAFQPVGAMSIPTPSGVPIVVDTGGVPASVMPGVITTHALGDALQNSRALTTIGYDSYHRLFKINLNGAYAPPRARGLIAAAPAQRQYGADYAVGAGARLSFASGEPLVSAPNAVDGRGFSQAADPSFAMVETGVGALALTAWRGQGGAQPDLGEPRDAFEAVAAPNQVEAAKINLGVVSLVAEGGTGERTPTYANQPRKASSYARIGADFAGRGFSARIAAGALDEPLGPLGSTITGAFALPSKTQFLTLGVDKGFAGGALLYAEASLGRTGFSGQLLQLRNSTTSSWRLGLASPCGSWRGCSHVGFEIDQPLRFESGQITATLAAVPQAYFAPLDFTTRRIGATPTGRELDFRVFADKDLGPFGLLSLEGSAASQEGNIASAPIGLGLLANWRVGF